MTDAPDPETPTQVEPPTIQNPGWREPGLSVEQVRTLLRPLNPTRVAHRQQGGKRLSYLEAYDVKAHLTRIFGFCGWDGEVLRSELIFQEPVTIGKDDKAKPGWAVGYQCIYRLRIKDWAGRVLATYTEASIGQNSQPDLGEAHDTACKTAESDAIKRCAINLGDQFGLSLYDDGSQRALIKRVLVVPEGFEDTRKELTDEQKDKLSHAVGHTEGDDPANERKIETVNLPDAPASGVEWNGPVPTPFDHSPVETTT